MIRKDACVLCQTPVIYSLPESEGYRNCLNCDLTWSIIEDPVEPKQGWNEDYYGRTDVLQLHERRQSGMKAIVARLTQVYPNRGYLLDIGAGVGLLLKVAANNGWFVEGIEASSIAADRARRLTGAKVHDGRFEDIRLPEAHYNAITIVDTLRHISDPAMCLKSARRLLRPGGILLIRELHQTVRRCYMQLLSRSESSSQNGHRRADEYAQCFSPKSLLYALHALELDAWVEPSPVFLETESGGGFVYSLLKRSVGLASNGVYKISGHRFIISPNVVAFGRAPLYQRDPDTENS